ncbi:MAG: exosortase/archaeosortase family protein [Bacteroidales bacterium]|nr:exosortase/archaeosortase family protein [Bacteroidales bacterium]
MKLFIQVKEIIRKYHLYALKDVFLFMVILLFFHVVWKIFASNFMAVDFIMNSALYLAEKVFYASKWVLEVLNVNVTTFDELTIGGAMHKNVIYYAPNNGIVYVNSSCSGLKQFYQWVFLMLLFPGPWKHKAWFIPLGIVIIHIVNIFRIVGMTYVTINLPHQWDYIHDWIMRPFFYIVMFLLWVWWNEKFHLKARKVKAEAKS